MSGTPTMAQAIRAAIESNRADLHTAIPGRVVSFNPVTQRASVQPLLRCGYRNERGERVVEDLPVVNEIPVVFPGAGSYSITWPIAKGDTVLLVFSEGSLDRWLHKGGVVDPEDDRRHHLTDAIAIPGLRQQASPTGGGATSALSITADEVRLGSKDADEPMILGGAFMTAFDVLIGAIATAAAGTGGGVTTTINTALETFHASDPLMLSDKVKAE